MSNRKETPDVLGEILSGSTATATTATATTAPESKPPSTPDPKSTRTKTGRANGAKATTSKRAKKRPMWVYMSVRFRDYRGWRPRYVDGTELSNWKSRPLIEVYLNQLGQEGWEMVGIVSNGRSERDAYFKRAAA